LYLFERLFTCLLKRQLKRLLKQLPMRVLRRSSEQFFERVIELLSLQLFRLQSRLSPRLCAQEWLSRILV